MIIFICKMVESRSPNQDQGLIELDAGGKNEREREKQSSELI